MSLHNLSNLIDINLHFHSPSITYIIHIICIIFALKDKKIKVLEEKVEIFQKSREQDCIKQGPTAAAKVKDLEKKCLLLQQQIHEMEVGH